ncbi:similar to spore coat protein CotH [Alteracholeplasma palmae J233]|uniref:Similar to spore coat protein CotH n=1 Tax=Alteracholeplasma palmae (strain ATCC 49389 / J233) TaxID=1318466 RepID=U4KQJ7_ALTPJ|nr:CotH kinase family protein [Alteracholeplasma palmae]CCV64700.1 similar to spore coat protein CotH [Alteracholeplasma palmae J233]
MKKIRLLCLSMLSIVLVSCGSPRYEVIFKDGENTVKTQLVIEGESALPPEMSDKDGHDFIGWDKKYSEIKGDLVVNAVYEVRKYTVIFKDYNGNELNKELVEYTKSANAPADPHREGYDFIRWDRDYSQIKSDLVVNAVYEVRKYTVIFKDYNGNELNKELVEYTKSANAPTDPHREGYDFIGWDRDYSQIKSDLVVNAVYKKKEYTIVFIDYDGSVLSEHKKYYDENIEYIDSPYRLGYKFIEWNEKSDDGKVIILEAIYEMEFFNLPTISVTLDGVDLEDVNRDNYVNSKISILNTTDENQLSEVDAEFKGRGNGSWTYDKKGYRIKFNKKQSLFGEKKSKHWVLVANGHDNSLMRNNTAYTIVNNVLDGIEYTTSVHIIELYVNGKYHGVYSLFEHIRVDKNRVNIDEDYGILDTGYLVEYDAYATGIEGIDYFSIEGLKYPFTVKSPDPDDYNKEGITEEAYRNQISYIQNYIQEFIDAIRSGDYEKVNELSDIDSIVDAYLIHELFKNTDTGFSSFYMYKKKGGKLFFGPIWDFDLSSGISRGDSTSEGLYIIDKVMQESEHTSSDIYIELMKQEVFLQNVKDRFKEITSKTIDEINALFTTITQYSDSYQRDYQRWNHSTNWNEEQFALKTWLLNRIEWMSNWANN